MFTPSKVGQMAAVFAHRQGGRVNILKLMKLLYLADRESIARYGSPISFDHMVSMDHGPVLSRTLNLINGCVQGPAAAKWEEWITDREEHVVSNARQFQRGDLDELSDADLDVLETVWSQFGHMDKWTIRDYTHTLPEWTNPLGSSVAIDEKSVLIAVGRNEDEATQLARDIQAERLLDRVLAES